MIDVESRTVLSHALASDRRTGGSTHTFYLYPARFSPEIASAVISQLSARNDCVIDPFMGGGTAVVEALMTGRRIIGTDLNALGHFVADVRTTPLSESDESSILGWASRAAHSNIRATGKPSTAATNFPAPVQQFIASAISSARCLQYPRRRQFARCALLRLGQWAVDCREPVASTERLAERLLTSVNEMIQGLREFVRNCRRSGVAKNEITSRKLLLRGDARQILSAAIQRCRGTRPQLVFTSPPYARVHVLYHRWQVRGRSETAAPYWIAGVPDGFYASHYTGGSRTPYGEKQYFRMIREVFSSLHGLLHPDAAVAQLVGFADIESQLPLFLRAMADAGYKEDTGAPQRRMWRNIPNRKWHAAVRGAADASSEVLLIHHPFRLR